MVVSLELPDASPELPEVVELTPSEPELSPGVVGAVKSTRQTLLAVTITGDVPVIVLLMSVPSGANSFRSAPSMGVAGA